MAQGCVCERDDPTAAGRHALIKALAVLGIEAEEDYLGAGSYVVIVPDLDGDWSITNTYDGMPWRYWGAQRVGKDYELLCSHHNLGEITAPPMLIARVVLERLMKMTHTLGDGDPDNGEEATGELSDAEIAALSG